MEIDEHVGCAMSGLTADARTLVEHGRVETQVLLLSSAMTVRGLRVFDGIFHLTKKTRRCLYVGLMESFFVVCDYNPGPEAFQKLCTLFKN